MRNKQHKYRLVWNDNLDTKLDSLKHELNYATKADAARFSIDFTANYFLTGKKKPRKV